MKKLVFLGFVLLVSCVSVSVSAQQSQKIRRNFLSYRFGNGEEYANEFDYVEIEWSRETENWLTLNDEPYAMSNNEETFDAVRANPGNYHTLTLTFHRKDGTTPSFLRFKGGMGNLGDRIEWGWMNGEWPGDIEGEGIYWNNRIQMATINFKRTIARHINGRSEVVNEAVDPVKGKNKLFLGVDGDVLVIELDGSFFPN